MTGPVDAQLNRVANEDATRLQKDSGAKIEVTRRLAVSPSNGDLPPKLTLVGTRGAILFALLTGKRQSDLDDELKQLCRDCIQPNRQDRPRDASLVADRIADYQNNVQHRLRKRNWINGLLRSKQRNSENEGEP